MLLHVTMLNSVLLHVIMMNVNMINVIMLNTIVLNVIKLNVILIRVIMLNVSLKHVLMLNIILTHAVMLNVILMHVTLQNYILPCVIMLNVVAPYGSCLQAYSESDLVRNTKIIFTENLAPSQLVNSSFSLTTKLGFNEEKFNGTACFNKCKQLLEYQHLLLLRDICGLYYNPFTIVNDDTRVINKLETHLLTPLEL